MPRDRPREVVVERVVRALMQRLARAGVDQEHPGVVEDRAPVGAGDAREQPAQVGDPRRQVARDREVVEDRVVLGPGRDLARVRVRERPVEELTEVTTGQVAVAVVEPLADDRALLREQELRRAADDPGRLVDDVRVAEREVAQDVPAGLLAGRVEEVRRRRVERVRVDRGLGRDGSGEGQNGDRRRRRSRASRRTGRLGCRIGESPCQCPRACSPTWVMAVEKVGMVPSIGAGARGEREVSERCVASWACRRSRAASCIRPWSDRPRRCH